jgi:hypothetical protein
MIRFQNFVTGLLWVPELWAKFLFQKSSLSGANFTLGWSGNFSSRYREASELLEACLIPQNIQILPQFNYIVFSTKESERTHFHFGCEKNDDNLTLRGKGTYLWL